VSRICQDDGTCADTHVCHANTCDASSTTCTPSSDVSFDSAIVGNGGPPGGYCSWPNQHLTFWVLPGKVPFWHTSVASAK
jgi:hypothetical protein